MFFRNIQKIWRPELYQGSTRVKGYFEGWYYKLADRNEQNISALIPGVSFDREGRNPHCFIQYLDNSGSPSHYYSYSIDQFSYSTNYPEIRIGNSIFNLAKINVNVRDNSSSIQGSLSFKGITPWPVSLFSPGAMGWYAFVPFMECYHGVLSFDHLIEGRLDLNEKSVNFSGGRGYIEKDWGRSFPSYHIWIQSNHFDEPRTSLMVSIANIPWLRKSFDGFLIGLLHNGHIYRFTTYSGAKITSFRYDQKKLVIHVLSKQNRLEIEVYNRVGAELRTPVEGDMQGRLSESLSAETKIRLYGIQRDLESLIFKGNGRHTGLEIEGGIPDELS